MPATRLLCVIADDYGIGPSTSRGILELAAVGAVTGTVLLVNSPHALSAVLAWKQAGAPLEMGWHPSLTLDAPICRPEEVPTLVGSDGRFRPLGRFLARLMLGLVSLEEVERELRAQFTRFVELVGQPPTLVNAHHHVAVFPIVEHALRTVLTEHGGPLPYLRRVREPWAMLGRIHGARIKRTVLNVFGRGAARRQAQAGLPGADWLVGVANPPHTAASSDDYFVRWLAHVPGDAVELACHPGHHDPTLVGRDGTTADCPLIRRRVEEMALLSRPGLPEAMRLAGFTLVAPSAFVARSAGGARHAA